MQYVEIEYIWVNNTHSYTCICVNAEKIAERLPKKLIRDVNEQKNLSLLFEIFINRMYSCISLTIKNKLISEKQ